MVILIVFSAFGTVHIDLEKRLEKLEIRGRIKIIQTTALLRSARILWKVPEIRGDFLFLRIQEKKTLVKTGMKKPWIKIVEKNPLKKTHDKKVIDTPYIKYGLKE